MVEANEIQPRARRGATRERKIMRKLTQMKARTKGPFLIDGPRPPNRILQFWMTWRAIIAAITSRKGRFPLYLHLMEDSRHDLGPICGEIPLCRYRCNKSPSKEIDCSICTARLTRGRNKHGFIREQSWLNPLPMFLEAIIDGTGLNDLSA